MTGLLEEALRRVAALSPEQQDLIASGIIEALDDEDALPAKVGRASAQQPA